MENAREQVADRLKQATNILVTVRNNPSVDLLCACLGLSLALDKLEKHAAAVFSGQIPSAIQFLKPEETIEPTPNSLRDFIIALDKSKADKLRYKVEDKVVRIFITPYKTSLSEADLEFSQGDFNIDVVIALGAHQQQDLDQAITAHGRILHDAVVISINNTSDGNLGTVNWEDTGASSVSEMVAQLADSLGSNILDGQISTALLTGIVAETDRFSNEKTTPRTMSMAGELMAAGANQQLVANELRHAGLKLDSQADDAKSMPEQPTKDSDKESSKPAGDDTLEIAHQQIEEAKIPRETLPKQRTVKRELLPPERSRTPNSPMAIDEGLFTQAYLEQDAPKPERSFLVDQPVLPESDKSESKPADLPASTPPEQSAPAQPAQPPVAAPATPPAGTTPKGQTLEELELAVKGTSKEPTPETKLDDARSQVLEALSAGPQPLVRPEAFNALPIADNLHGPATPSATPAAIQVDAEGHLTPASEPQDVKQPVPADESPTTVAAAGQPLDMPLPPVMEVSHPTSGSDDTDHSTPTAPPPGPPPMLPPFPMNPAA